MKIILAPMHGYADDVMRRLLTEIGGFDEVVSEFVRITHTIHSRKTWLKYIPELDNASLTPAGIPCTVQLLGSDADKMAENACMAASLGARTIDLNFGCPAPSVNQHDGGAILLREPCRIEHIVRSVRQRLPETVLLSAKMRLGFTDTALAIECAQAIAAGGAEMVIVHARTKVQAYMPPAQWEWFARIQAAIDIPLIANGDIFSVGDFVRLQKMCSPHGIMLGRGALRYPYLARQIRAYLHGISPDKSGNEEIWPVIRRFFVLCQQKDSTGKYALARLKQWLPLLSVNYPQVIPFLYQIRPLNCIKSIARILDEAD